MDEIKQRLKEASEACITTYEAWSAKPDIATRESLQEAVHELRKIGARLEIELAVSDRKSFGNDPIPIPSHRASRRQGQEIEQTGDDEGNRQGGGNQGGGGNRLHGRDGRPQGGSRPVQIRQKEEAAAPQPGNDSATAEAPAADGDRKGKPLSLKRSGGDTE